ncbi:hypothetical protein BC826DRAFT_373727 [Russula brevipes]|nr:hypothetical protein BC826DRAFT_373727 [Russula brevipes]
MDVNLPHSYRYNQGLGDWVPFTHPGGALYFYHKSWRIFTDVYVYDPELSAEVLEFARLLNEEVLKLVPNVSPWPTTDYDLVLDIVETKDKETVWQYYFVDHNKKTLFWLEHYDMSSLLYEIPGVTEPGHIKHRLESLYWVHWSLYPVGYQGRKFPRDASKELLGVLLSSSIDSLTSRVSTAPYSVADMETMRDIIKDAKDLSADDAHTISSVARLLSICAFWRFVHFHGQKTSRQDRNKSIYSSDCHKPTMLICLLSPLLFFAPDVHLRELKKVWADKLVIEEVWKKFMEQLVSEWVELVLYATVMLAANVGFLATQNISAPVEAASSISLVLSIGSIISGLLLVRRNRTMAAQDMKTAWNYLDRMDKRRFYLEPLAIIFSLTYALLMWSVCSFFIAVLISSFWKAKKNIWIPVAVSASFVAALILWCIVNSWDSDSDEDDPIDNLLNQ